jgi:hypothetical protein
VLKVAESGTIAVFGVGLEAESELAGEVGKLGGRGGTPGREVVWWQKVDPVGGMS